MAKKLTKKEKMKIAVAKDVLKSLGSLRLTKETYLCVDNGMEFNSEDDQLKDYIPKMKKNCEVCAVGSLFLSTIGLFNKCKINQVMVMSIQGDYYPYIDKMFDKLKEVFTRSELILIEGAFMLDNMDHWYVSDIDIGIDLATLFGEKYKSDKRRLKAICENIVRYGTFRPDLGLKRISKKDKGEK